MVTNNPGGRRQSCYSCSDAVRSGNNLTVTNGYQGIQYLPVEERM
jgi:hypothetical protein